MKALVNNVSQHVDMSSTGEHLIQNVVGFTKCEIGPYEVTVVIDSFGKFLGVREIAIRKDFRSSAQKIEGVSVQDVDDIYKD